MRLLAIFLFLALPVAAADEASLADRFPKGATAYFEARDLAGKLDDVLASPLATALRDHAGLKQALASPQMAQVLFAEAFVKGATGHDFEGLFRAIAGKEIAAAAYGSPQRLLLLARVDPEAAERILAGAEILSKQQRAVVTPADGATPALWQLGPAFVCLDGDVLAVSTDQLLAAAVRGRTAEGLGADERLAQARRAAGRGDAFAFVDLAVHAPGRKSEKAKDVGQALIAGLLGHVGAEAPWAALSLDLAREGDGVRLAARAAAPVPAGLPPAARDAYSGTLAPFPFALPADTIGIVRLHRSLPALWSHRDDLVAEREIPKLVEFETNFGNLTGGMDFVEQFLPSLKGDEMSFLATRRTWPKDAPAPAIRLPQMAFLFPVAATEEMATRLQVAFQTGIGIVNATQGMMTSSFMTYTEMYDGVLVQFARYLPPSKGELEANQGLPIRYNFEPSAALVDGHYVFATSPGIVKQLIDGRGKSTPAGEGINAGLWLKPAAARESLAENREALVANTMLKEGDDRATAEGKIDLLLDLTRYVESVSFTAEEGPGTFALALELRLGGEGVPGAGGMK
jgi:hypothetical protein